LAGWQWLDMDRRFTPKLDLNLDLDLDGRSGGKLAARQHQLAAGANQPSKGRGQLGSPRK
jgi:hypothetical protein